MNISVDRPKTSKLIRVELSKLPRKPHGCPPEVERSWARLLATHKSVSGLFTTLNDLRAAQNDPRGAISELHLDQARAAPICIMTWGNAVQERVVFWLHELPGQEMIYHHVSLPLVFWLHLRTVQRRLCRSDPIFGRHADVTWG